MPVYIIDKPSEEFHMRRRIAASRLIELAVAASILPACSHAPMNPASESMLLARIPLEIRYGIPNVDVTIAGRKLRLFLDLGGHRAISLTYDELAQVVVTPSPGMDSYRNIAGEYVQTRRFVAPDVRVAGFPLGDLEGGEFPLAANAPPDRNGYIGFPVLRRHLLVFDYPERELRIYRSGDRDAMAVECGSTGFDIVVKDGVAISSAVTEYGNLVFAWDTGTTSNFVRDVSVRAAGARIDEGPPQLRMNSVRLGGQDIGPQEFRVLPFNVPAVDGFLGAGLLAQRRVCLDIPEGRGSINLPR